MSFDDPLNAALTRTIEDVRARVEAEWRSFAADLVRQADAQRDAQIARVQEDAEAKFVDLTRLLDAARAEREGAQAARESAEVERDRAQAERDSARAARETAQRELESSLGQLDALRGQLTASEQERAAIRGTLEAAQREREAAQQEVEAAQRKVEAGQRELEAAQRTLEAAQRTLEAAQRELETARREIEVARRELDAVHRDFALRIAQLVDAVASIDTAQTFGDVLEVLAESAIREVERVAVLVLRDRRLVGWRLSGFANMTSSPRSLSLSLDEAGIAGVVVTTGTATSRLPDDSSAQSLRLPPFAQDPWDRHAAALPVMVGGEVVAVLYADAPSSTPSNGWFAILDVLSRHASRVLESLTVQRAVGGFV